MANVKNTQLAREVAIETDTRNAEVGQIYLDVAIMPDGGYLVSQQIIEVANNLPIQLLVERTLRLSGEALLSIGENPATIWLNTRKKKLIYLVTLTLRYVSGSTVVTENLYLSNHAYNTRANETPPNTEFIAVLREEDIPPFKQELTDTLYGFSIPSFGKIVINNADGQFDDKLPPSRVWEGGDVVVKLTGDRSELDLTYAITIFTGVMGKLTYSDNKISVEILSKAAELSSKNIPNTTFTGPNDEKITSAIAYGYVNNLAPYLKDPIEYTYKIAGHAIDSITAVYDNGVLLSAGQYTADLANAEFTLVAVPAGIITCDVKGKKINGVFSANRADFIHDMLTSYGGLIVDEIDGSFYTTFKNDVPGDSGIYFSSETSILNAIALLLKPVLGYLSFSRHGIAMMGKFKIPDSSTSISLTLHSHSIFPQGDAESDASVSGDILVTQQVDYLIAKAVMLYNHNYTVQDGASLGSAFPVDPDTESGAARRAWLAQESLRTEIENVGPTIGRSLYPTAKDMDPLETFFINKSDADSAGQYWLDVFGVQRFLVSVRCTSVIVQTLLHSIIQLDYTILDEETGGTKNRWYTNKLTRSVAYEENYADNIINMLLFI